MSRRLAVPLAVLCLLVAGCGDDDDSAADESVEPNATATVVEPDESAADDDEPTTTTSTVPDAAAEEPPGESGGEDDGLGDEQVYVADLTGGEAQPEPGDTGATGRAEIESTPDGRFCFDMIAEGLGSDVADAHIHDGAAGASGGVVVPIGPPTSSAGATDTWTDVCVAVDDALREQIAADPSGYYVNVHTTEFPQGAVRGQLGSATIFDLTLS